jgi:hypothetical protein
VIRQAISCDICGTEKKQTNHWFVAYDQGGELRVSGWNSRNRLRPGSRHLCGQTCLHKLVDDFMAKALTARPSKSAHTEVEDEVMEQAVSAGAGMTSSAAYQEIESSARLIPTPKPVAPEQPVRAHPVMAPIAAERLVPAPAVPVQPIAASIAPAPIAPTRPPLRMPMELVIMPSTPRTDLGASPAGEPPRYASRNWRAAAWERERERERELRAGERHSSLIANRHYN